MYKYIMQNEDADIQNVPQIWQVLSKKQHILSKK